MSTIFLLSAIISRPIAGQWMERAGHKKMLLIAVMLFAGASIFYFFPRQLPASCSSACYTVLDLEWQRLL